VHCSKARDTVDRAIKKHEMKNAEESLPMWEELSAFFSLGSLSERQPPAPLVE
jgi:hypothetical protein